MQKFLRRWLDGLYLTCGWIAGFSLISILLLIVIQMTTRWLGISPPGLSTYAGYAMGWTSFFALGYALSKGAHIRVTLVLGGLGIYRRYAEIFCVGVSVIISIFFSYFAIKTTYWSYLLGEVSQAQDATPIWIPQIAMAVGTVVLSIALIDLFVQILFPNVQQSFQLDSEQIG